MPPTHELSGEEAAKSKYFPSGKSKELLIKKCHLCRNDTFLLSSEILMGLGFCSVLESFHKWEVLSLVRVGIWSRHLDFAGHNVELFIKPYCRQSRNFVFSSKKIFKQSCFYGANILSVYLFIYLHIYSGKQDIAAAHASFPPPSPPLPLSLYHVSNTDLWSISTSGDFLGSTARQPGVLTERLL